MKIIIGIIMEVGVFEFLISSVTILAVFYTCTIFSALNYWKKRGVPGPQPIPIFGNIAEVFFMRKAMPDKLRHIYDTHKSEPFVGLYFAHQPVLLLKDLDLIKQVLVKDFNVFHGRGIKTNEEVEPLLTHLFNIDGIRWKFLRQKLRCAFSSAKYKLMFPLILESADVFGNHMKDIAEDNNMIESREQASRYAIDVIAHGFFGMATNNLMGQKSILRKISLEIFDTSFSTQLKRWVREMAPSIYYLLRLRVTQTECTDFFLKFIKDTVEFREREKIVRNDFITQLLQIREENMEEKSIELTDTLLAAQAFGFLTAGYETSAGTLSFALYELSRKLEIQGKLRQEIIEFDKKNCGQITYENLNEMKYLDMVVKETLRKNPPLTRLQRQASQDYVIPGTNVKLPVGQKIIIPVFALHHDAAYFPEPDVFDPERFSDAAQQDRHSMVYLPFGDGPKKCIASKFGTYVVKLGLIVILRNFRVTPINNNNEPYAINKGALTLTPVNGIVLKFDAIV